MIIAKAKKNITEEDDFEEFKGDTLLRLDLGCGKNKKEGFLGVDQSENVDADIIWNLETFPWPFEESSVYEIFCSHYVEHTKDLVAFMEECYRIMMDQAIITIVAPYYTSVRAWQDPTHIREISEMTWMYYDAAWRKVNNLEHYNINCNFKNENTKFIFYPEYISRGDEAREWARKHLNNVVLDGQYILRAIKRS